MALGRPPLPAEDHAIDNLHLETTVKNRLIVRSYSLALAVLVTLAVFGSIDHLAARESASAVWAWAVSVPQG